MEAPLGSAFDGERVLPFADTRLREIQEAHQPVDGVRLDETCGGESKR